MPLTEEQLMLYVRDNLGVDTTDIETSTPLFSSTIIDSFSLISLITFIEESTGIQVAPQDITLEHFDSIEGILAYSNRRDGSQ